MNITIYRIKMKFKTWWQKICKLIKPRMRLHQPNWNIIKKRIKKLPYRISTPGIYFHLKKKPILNERYDERQRRHKREKKLNFMMYSRYRKVES